MNDREILTACLRWHTARCHRLEIGAEQRQFQKAQMERIGFSGTNHSISVRLTAAKRLELAALRQLAKVCAKVRSDQRQIADADVIDVPMLITCDIDSTE